MQRLKERVRGFFFIVDFVANGFVLIIIIKVCSVCHVIYFVDLYFMDLF